LSRSFGLAGDHIGQETRGYRWPFGATAVITPFNFPIEIPLLQGMSSLFMGNKVVIKSDSKVQIVMEQCLRMLHHAGLPKTDMDLMYSEGPACNELVVSGNARMTLFTGSQAVADKLAVDLKGRLKLEDAGFDWKVLGPDVSDVEYVAWQCDQDAYAFSGQKCSAQSIMFMHKNWTDEGIVEKLAARAGARNVEDLSIGPVLTWSNEKIQGHIQRLLKIPGAYVAFGGEPLENHAIPAIYGSMEPTAVFVPIKEILNDEHWPEVTRELFGPFQVITEYTDEELPMVLEALERMDNHLTGKIRLPRTCSTASSACNCTFWSIESACHLCSLFFFAVFEFHLWFFSRSCFKRHHFL
jgi:1-pyrroline-5-carboxylate dehydrogenase